MNKIGLLTFYISNYGSVLQAYSTKTFLAKHGYTPVPLKKVPFGEDPRDVEESMTRHPEGKSDFDKFMASLSTNKSRLSNRSLELINDFIENEIAPQECTMDELRSYGVSKDFYAFITGSDQVWNCTLGMLSPIYYLKFVPPAKRIALAPSFGANNVPSYLKEDLKEVLSEYNYLSAREDEGVKIIKDISGHDAIRLADPTLLITTDEWREFAKKPEQNGYVFLHFLDEPNDIALDAIKQFASESGMDIICFSTRYESIDKIEGIKIVDGSPMDYVGLIDNANLVLTDSFHTTMFSINMDTPFYSFDRQYVHGVSQVSRITTALNMYHLSDRLIMSFDNDIKVDDYGINTDYSSVKDEERSRISQYLLKALKEIENV